MLLQPRITFHDLPYSAAIERTIINKIDKLDQFYGRIMHCDVVVEQVTKHHHKGKLYNTRITLTVPGEEIHVDRARNEDVYVSARDAFNAAKRKLQDFSRRRRGDIKSHPLARHGVITRIVPQEGYGFIESDNNDYYFSFNNLVNVSFEDLALPVEVSFIPSSGMEGLQANRITIGKHQPLENF